MDTVSQLFHNSSPAIMKVGYSYKVKIRRDYINQKGLCALVLRVTINRKHRDLPLNIHVHPNHFNEDSAQAEKWGTLSDQDLSDLNLMIRNEVAKATNIFVEYRLSRRDPELQDFIRQFTDYDRRDSFISYYQRDLNARKDLAGHTSELHQNTLNLLTKFQKEVRFGDLKLELINTFDRWLKTEQNHNHNTRHREHTDLHQYIRRAIASGVRIADPYVGFKWPTPTRSIVFLEQGELQAWTDYYFSSTIKRNHKRSLRYFLFACYTSLRISDAKALLDTLDSMLNNSTLIFVPKKTKNTKGELIRLPINDMAKKFMSTMKDREFEEPCDQTINRDLKAIAGILETDKNISFKVGRHTFATIFLERGGAVEVLQQILGHSDIEETMVYVHITNDRTRKQVESAFNGFHHSTKGLWDHVPVNTRKKGSGRKKPIHTLK
jgi:integrase/recombinase XerD